MLPDGSFLLNRYGLHWSEVTATNLLALNADGEILEGEGEFTFRAGDAWLQPPGIRHDVLAFSEDLEVLEVVSPGVFETRDG
jgi:uncharacterized protein YjlB